MDNPTVEAVPPAQISTGVTAALLGPVSHGANVRGLAAGANAGLPFGRFGPMFDLPACPTLPDAGLSDLAELNF